MAKPQHQADVFIFIICAFYFITFGVPQQIFIGNKLLAVMSWRLYVQCSSRRQRECPIYKRFIAVAKFTIWITTNFSHSKIGYIFVASGSFSSIPMLILYLQSLTFTDKIYSSLPRNAVFIPLNYMSNQFR